jgi:hypothetical protein
VILSVTRFLAVRRSFRSRVALSGRGRRRR